MRMHVGKLRQTASELSCLHAGSQIGEKGRKEEADQAGSKRGH